MAKTFFFLYSFSISMMLVSSYLYSKHSQFAKQLTIFVTKTVSNLGGGYHFKSHTSCWNLQ